MGVYRKPVDPDAAQVVLTVDVRSEGCEHARASFDAVDIRVLYHFIERSLRGCDMVHPSVRVLRGVVNRAVWQQAYDRGWDDARNAEISEPRATQATIPLWRDAYLQGWAESKSELEG